MKKFCNDCGLPSTHHIKTWIDECASVFSFELALSKKAEAFFDVVLEKFFGFIGLLEMREDFVFSNIQPRSSCFINEARKRGIVIKAARGPYGYTGYFRAEVNGKSVSFDGLPTATFAGACSSSLIESKERTKNYLKKGFFPVADGKIFWFWQKNKAIRYGVDNLGFPLVVKPLSGSVARHVTIKIKSKEELKKAIRKAILYSPVYMVEKFVENSFVYRATVVDFDYVACVTQVPANVVGDGASTIELLVQKKNEVERRGELNERGTLLLKIVIDETTAKILAEKKYNMDSVPIKDEVVFLQNDPFLRFGGDLVEVTRSAHPDNIQLFKDVARFFDIRLVGIDFMIPDIAVSWRKQHCAILELNSMPCIEMHHFPSSGVPQNVAGAVVDLFFKYYF